MARLLNRIPLSRGNRLEVMWKGHLEVKSTVVISRTYFSSGLKENYKKQMWKRLKKNDPEMNYFLSDVTTQKRIIDLAKVMRCTVEQATELVKRDSPLGVTDSDKLHKRIKLLMSYKFSAQDIIANPSVLHRTYEVLQQRLAQLKILKCPPNQRSLSILKKSVTGFKSYVNKCNDEDRLLSLFSSREHCLASLLECNVESAKNLTDEYGLESVSLVLLKNKIDVFRRFQISSAVIQNELKSIVNTSVTVLESRLHLLSDNNVLNFPEIKLGFMLSCKESDFERSVISLKNNCYALEGYKDKKEYLIFRLKCSEKVAEGLSSSKPINSMSMVKLQKMLDFFLDEMKVSYGFVISNVYLLGYSLERMQNRWPIISSKYTKSSWIPRLLSISEENFQKHFGKD